MWLGFVSGRHRRICLSGAAGADVAGQRKRGGAVGAAPFAASLPAGHRYLAISWMSTQEAVPVSVFISDLNGHSDSVPASRIESISSRPVITVLR